MNRRPLKAKTSLARPPTLPAGAIIVLAGTGVPATRRSSLKLPKSFPAMTPFTPANVAPDVAPQTCKKSLSRRHFYFRPLLVCPDHVVR